MSSRAPLAISALIATAVGGLLAGPLSARAVTEQAPARVAAASGAGSWTWPVVGEVITPYRNGGDPYAAGEHRGIDVAAETGTPVVAAVAGTVRFAGVAGSSGLTVSVRTADGRFDTSYLHLSETAVREGDGVSAGDRLGAVGTSGRRSAERAHLHFGVRDAGSRHAYHDPLGFLPPPPARAPQPRGAPEPVAAPVPVAPLAEPVPVRAPAGRRVRVPVDRRAPAGRRVPAPAGRRVPAPVPGRIRVPGLGRVPQPVVAPAAHGLPALGPTPGGASASAPASGPAGTLDARPDGRPAPAEPMDGRAPGLGPAATGEPSGGHVARAPGQPEAASSQRASGGLQDLGWALACTGLLLAAACLGRSSGGSRDARGGDRPLFGGAAAMRASVRSLLRPLTGGR